MSHSVLLTFTGFHDPYTEGPVEGSLQPGPILSLLGERKFRRVILFSTPMTVKLTEETREAIRESSPKTKVITHHLDLQDPTDYSAILAGIRRFLPRFRRHRSDSCFVATASGTPQMHACWMLLVSSGELRARLLHVRPPRFVSRDVPLVSEVDLAGPEFPEALSAPMRVSEVDPTVHGFPEVRAEAMEEIAAMAPAEPDLSVICEEMGIVGDDPGFIKALSRAVTVAPYDEPVLIRGENGTGKEIIARLIHQTGNRSGSRMVTVNCSAIPEELAESILFGHKKGSFTGAIQDEPGKFRLADGGTLFLDEVGELSGSIQAKLLRAVEYGIIEPVGEGREIHVDVRLVAASNRDLSAMVEEGRFRQDLYYRLKGARIEIPPLRQRRGDISRLAVHFLERFRRQHHRHWFFTPEALRRLLDHDWPGNVRELEHLVRVSAMLCSGRKIGPDDLEDPYPGFQLEEYISGVREQLFNRALELAGGRQSKAARLLGISDAAVSRYVAQQRKAGNNQENGGSTPK